MMVKPTRCARCNGRMVEGHIIDSNYGAGSATPSRWQPGEIVRRWWGSIKVDDAVTREILSFRCERCGCLESYAV